MAALNKTETEAQHISSLLSSLQSQRKECQFTDITIECGQRGFVAHRVILYAGSPYFRDLFNNEAPGKPIEKVELNEVECDAVESVLKFIYTGKIDALNEGDDGGQLKSLLAVTHLLRVDVLYEYYWSEFSKRLTVDSYVDVWKTATLYGSAELLAVIPNYLAINFKAASSADDFLDLTVHQLKQLLDAPEMENSDADCVTDACIKWIKHLPDQRKHELVPLFSHVDFNDLSNQFLGHVLHSEPLVTECTELFDKLFAVAINRLVHTEGQATTPRPYFVCCGKLDGKSVVTIYDFKAKMWMPPKVLAIPLTLGTAVSSYDGALYFMGGGETNADAMDCVFKYYPATNSITTLARLLIPTYHAGAGVLGNKLYLVGGLHRNKVTNCVERYDPVLDEWISVAPTVKAHSFTNVVTFQDNLYVVGSYKCSTVERYNIDTNQWLEITQIPSPLGDGWPRATIHRNRFWVFRDLTEKKFHMYDPSSNQWEVRDFQGGPENVYGLWGWSNDQMKQLPLVVLDSSNYSYYFYHDETSTWDLLPLPKSATDCYYWQSLMFIN